MKKLFFFGCLTLIAASSQAQEIWGFSVPLLDGNQSVPPTGSIAYGSGAFTINEFFNMRVTGSISITGIDVNEVTGMHIHHAPVGQNGPVIFDILANLKEANQGVGTSNFFFTGTLQGDGNLTAQQKLAVMVAGNAYVNVHTTEFPTGEIRGQIVCVVPEPASIVAVGLGLGSLLLLRRRKVTSS
ncbi:MAG: CHRD domain-containing protein [Fimbriimonadales bacterium]